MKTFVYFILTLCISCGCLAAATNTKHPLFLFIAAFGIWLFFFWGWNSRIKKQAERRSQEQLFADYMRSKIQNDRTRK
jgi:hypothetical protein